MNSIPNVVWPILIIVMWLISISRTPKVVNFWNFLLFQPVWLFVLTKAGFFDVLYFPQFIWGIFYVLSFIMVAVAHGVEISEEYRKTTFSTVIVSVLFAGLYYWGGAFKYFN